MRAQFWHAFLFEYIKLFFLATYLVK